MLREEERSSPKAKARKMQNSEVSAKELWQELNRFRKNPHLIYSILSSRKLNYNKQGLLFSPFHPLKSIQTVEGREPISALLEELVNLQPLRPIAYNSQLNRLAQDLARQFKACHNSNAEFSIDYKELRRILQKNQKYFFPHPVACLVGVGFCEEYQPLISLLVDDGSLSRKNRRILMGNQYQVCGIGALPLADNSLVCAVFLFTQSVISKSIISEAF